MEGVVDASFSSPMSTRSSVQSFHTATQPDSPILSGQSSRSGLGHRQGLDEDQAPYRPVKALPTELANHMRVYLEEELYTKALSLADGLLTAGLSRDDGRVESCQVPPPVQIAFITNLLVHPKHTSRAEPADRAEVALRAGNYLDSLLQVAGPVSAKLNEAFQFNPNFQQRVRSSPGEHGAHDDFGDHDVDEANARVVGKLRPNQLLWNCGSDFWSVVGWAFNCAVVHPSRWKWWRNWLDFMLRVLWEDWEARCMLDVEAADTNKDGGGVLQRHMMIKSLLASYATQRSRRDYGLKYIVRALFADGHTTSLSLFTEVFPKETLDLPRTQNKRKREEKLDLDRMQYGDYGESDDELDGGGSDLDDAIPTSPATKLGTGKNIARELTKYEHYTANKEALHDLVCFRLKIMSLLTAISDALPNLFVNQIDLYEQLALSVKELPIPIFEAILAPNSGTLAGTLAYFGTDRGDLTFLIRELLHHFLPAKYLNPAKVDKVADQKELITTEMMERCYLPHTAKNATSMEDNAKLSILLEKALTLLIAEADGKLEPTESLRNSLETGIEMRNKRAKLRKERNGQVSDQETMAKERLAASSRMLTMILNHINTIAA